MTYTRTSADRKAEWAAELERVRALSADELVECEANYELSMAEAKTYATYGQERPAQLRGLTATARAIRIVKEDRGL